MSCHSSEGRRQQIYFRKSRVISQSIVMIEQSGLKLGLAIRQQQERCRCCMERAAVFCPRPVAAFDAVQVLSTVTIAELRRSFSAAACPQVI